MKKLLTPKKSSQIKLFFEQEPELPLKDNSGFALFII